MRSTVFAVVAGITILFAGSAFAGGNHVVADDPATGSIQRTASYDWTGAYIGATAGYGWGRNGQVNGAGDIGPYVDIGRAAVSAEVGINWQPTDHLLLGLETDISTELSGSDPVGTDSGVAPYAYYCGSGRCFLKIGYLGTVRGRVGATFGRWLVFGTGGLAYGSVSGGIKNSTWSDLGATTRIGWTAGGGVAYAINHQIAVKAEFLHTDLGTVKVGTLPYYTEAAFNMARIGFDIRF
jgi:outer membrane immunogenic protein